jgi:hypothetical protein
LIGLFILSTNLHLGVRACYATETARRIISPPNPIKNGVSIVCGDVASAIAMPGASMAAASHIDSRLLKSLYCMIGKTRPERNTHAEPWRSRWEA